MSALDEWVRNTVWPKATFVPCPPDQPCENCDHPLSTHMHETADYFATACGVCGCQHWVCRHGGHRERVTS